jgi:ubiquinone/menaquinone biosynthesis C-methylase UbiE
MEATMDHREKQKNAWNKFSGGWGEWDHIVLPWLQSAGEKLKEYCIDSESNLVLDMATGTGEPGISIAQDDPNRHVIGYDLAVEMLSIAKKNAESRGVSNYETQAGEETTLPFADNHFDSVVSRFGVIFFPDPVAGIKEMVRVLKPGRKMAVTVWNAPELNKWAGTIGMVVNEAFDLPHPPADAPGIFRCAEPGTIEAMLEEAGMSNISSEILTGKNTFESAEHYWDFMTAIAAPIASALKTATPEQVAEVKEKVLTAAENFRDEDGISFGWSSTAAVATK